MLSILFIAISQLGFPVAISKLVAEETKNNKNLVFSIIPIALIINSIILVLIFLSSNFIANVLLHEERCETAIICIGFVLPFISSLNILSQSIFWLDFLVKMLSTS